LLGYRALAWPSGLHADRMTETAAQGRDTVVTDIFQEVEEDVRREKLEQIWRRYGAYIIGAAAAAVLFTGALTAWRAYEGRVRAERARAFMAASAVLESEPAQAAKAFEDLAGKSGTYAILARMRQAEALLKQGEPKKAAALYDDIAANARAPSRLRDLATLKSAYLNADTTSLADLRARLAPLIRADGDWRHSARTLLAFAALKEGERDAAIGDFRKLADDPTAPESARNVAATMLKSLGAAPAASAAQAQTTPSSSVEPQP
jgi:hypothetical protein